MRIYIKNHNFHYEVESLVRLFIRDEKIVVIKDNINILDFESYIYTEIINYENENKIFIKIKLFEEINEDFYLIPKNTDNLEKESERIMSVMLFKILSDQTGIIPPWGILTGIRPVKIMRSLTRENSLEYAKDYFINKLLVSQEKTELGIKTMQAENQILDLSTEKSFSLYVSIPFCPTRCSYCSFVSQSIEKAIRLIPQYVDLLCLELIQTAQIAKKLSLKLETVYIGGGTPTTLNSEQLEKIIGTINSNFDMTTCREFTIEAGRPDTITKEKLVSIKNGGVSRISINPQTLNDNVLKVIGRQHTANQTIECYEMARLLGFKNINMDLIAGLPCDGYESFINTLKKILKLNPENITIHSLALKRAANINIGSKNHNVNENNLASKMVGFAGQELLKNGYIPYYLYRQKNIIDNLENVGWSKKGFEGLYNVYIMDETHTILACGAGAVTKIKSHKYNRLERIFNFKFPYEYIDRFNEIIEKKEQVRLIYDKLC